MLGAWAVMALLVAQAGVPDPAKALPVLTAADFDKAANRGFARYETQAFRLQVHPRLPPFRLLLIPRPESQERGTRWGPISPLDPDTWVRYPSREVLPPERIVIRREDRKTVQVLSFQSSLGLLDSFRVHDVDFDGYLDLSVVKEHGGKWVQLRVWRFDPRSGRFVETPRTRALGRRDFGSFDADTTRREIRDEGMYADCFPDVRVYRWRGNDLELVEAWELRPSIEAPIGYCRSVHKKRVNGRMRAVGPPTFVHSGR